MINDALTTDGSVYQPIRWCAAGKLGFTPWNKIFMS